MRRSIVVMVAVAACGRVEVGEQEPPIERLVDAPITLAEVRARAKPDVSVDIRSETVHITPNSSGGGGCHGGGCALALVLELLPKRDTPYDIQYQHATIRDHGVLVYEAVFESERFDGAWLREGDRGRLINKVYAAGKWRLVEIGTAPIQADGTPGELTRSSLLRQVDLAPTYLAKLVEDQEHGKHKEGGVGETLARSEAKAQLTIAEMARVLAPDEAAALGRAWQAEPRLNAKVKELLRHQLVHDWN